jgi:hypothetical protein
MEMISPTNTSGMLGAYFFPMPSSQGNAVAPFIPLDRTQLGDGGANPIGVGSGIFLLKGDGDDDGRDDDDGGDHQT